MSNAHSAFECQRVEENAFGAELVVASQSAWAAPFGLTRESGHEDVERGQRNAVASQAQRVRQADEVVPARERILEPRSRGAVDGGGVARPAEDIIPFEGEGREEQLRNERLELLVVHVFRKRRARQEAGLEHEARGAPVGDDHCGVAVPLGGVEGHRDELFQHLCADELLLCLLDQRHVVATQVGHIA